MNFYNFFFVQINVLGLVISFEKNCKTNLAQASETSKVAQSHTSRPPQRGKPKMDEQTMTDNTPVAVQVSQLVIWKAWTYIFI